MPQLDTSHWFITILTMMITLFMIFQYKISKFTILFYPYKKMMDSTKHKNPWELKWTKIYLPHFQPQH